MHAHKVKVVISEDHPRRSTVGVSTMSRVLLDSNVLLRLLQRRRLRRTRWNYSHLSGYGDTKVIFRSLLAAPHWQSIRAVSPDWTCPPDTRAQQISRAPLGGETFPPRAFCTRNCRLARVMNLSPLGREARLICWAPVGRMRTQSRQQLKFQALLAERAHFSW